MEKVNLVANVFPDTLGYSDRVHFNAEGYSP